MPHPSHTPLPQQTEIAIVGAGFGGLGMTCEAAPSASASSRTRTAAATCRRRPGTPAPPAGRIETSQGPLSAKALVAAPGLLSEPTMPLISGIGRFRGTIFHTARWNHAHDTAGERVALIGTGATAIQVGPRIRPQVSRLHVFQRTPPWILPHPDRAISPRLRRLYRRVPVTQRLDPNDYVVEPARRALSAA